MRAKSLGTCGIMITASHNHHEDNGIKIFEPDGKLLSAEWELLAEMIINSVDLIWSMKNINELTLKGFPTMSNLFGVEPIPPPLPKAQTLEEMKETENYVHEPEFPHVFIAHDTRESSPAIVDAVKRGLECLHVPYTEHGLITTPMLCYLLANHKLGATVDSYVDNFSNAFLEFVSLVRGGANNKYERRMVVDCANGVAALHMSQIAQRIE